MVQNSLIIPSTGRDKNLSVCLASIRQSAEVCGMSDYEVIIVGDTQLLIPEHVRYIPCYDMPPVVLRQNESPPYWKGHMQNLGIEASRGDVITFLDADAVVGPQFMRGARRLPGDESMTKLAYRVRNIRDCEYPFFDKYDEYPLAYEDPLDGNSQFSITREKLGPLRFDEQYWGRGYEDLSFNRTIREHYGADFRCGLVTCGDYAMFHIKHKPSDGFSSDRWSKRNERMYNGDTTVWAFCHSKKAQFALADSGFTGRITSATDMGATLPETIPGDVVLEVAEVEK